MKTHFDRRKSLQDLEEQDWGEPEFDSNLVRTCHRLRRVPLADFTVENLRIMIGQKIGLLFLVPLAIEALQEDPFAEGDHYPGDLLNVVLAVPDSFWSVHANMRDVLRQLVDSASASLLTLPEDDARLIRDVLAKASAVQFASTRRRQVN